MNPEQAKSIVRHIFGAGGGFLVGWAVSRGYQWGNILEQLLSSEVFIGLIATGLMAFWGWVGKKQPHLIALVNSFIGVKGVITDNTAVGKALADSVPSPTVVPAGTTQAAEIAKPV